MATRKAAAAVENGTSPNGTSTISEAAAVAEEVTAPPVEELVLSNGLKLRIKPIVTSWIQKAAGAIEDPEVPKIVIPADPDRGRPERTEENPDDPGYIDALMLADMKRVEIAGNVMLALGTEILELPAGLASIDSDDWLDALSYFGVDTDLTSKTGRYLSYLTLYAMATPDDLVKAIGTVAIRSGITEEEVSKMLDSFRARAVRRTHGGLSPEATGSGDNV